MLFHYHNNSNRCTGVFVYPITSCGVRLIPELYESVFALTSKMSRLFFSTAVILFIFITPLAAQHSLSTAVSKIDSVSVYQQKKQFESATIQYLNALTNGLQTQTDLELLRQEITFFTLLLTTVERKRITSLKEVNLQEAAQSVMRLWKSLDPTPDTSVNERLIEHRVRIHEAMTTYSDPESTLGIDDRGIIYIKYGEPDRILDQPLNITRGEIYEFVMDFYLSRIDAGSTSGLAMAASDIADRIIESIYEVPFSTNLNVWLYKQLDSVQDNSVAFYFSEQKNNVFKRITSLDDWLPTANYRPSRSLPFSPALPLQYLSYQRLMFEDQIFMDTFNRLHYEIFDKYVPRSNDGWGALASNLKTNNNQIETRRQLRAPPENSTEEDSIPNIELNVHQYRSFNTQFEPVLITFFESRPTAAFLQDLNRNNDQMVSDTEDPDQIISLISQWYSLQQGIELFDANLIQVGRIRDTPVMQIESDTPKPTTTIADLPYISDGASQVFYSKLYNTHPATIPAQPTLFPDELRGMGRVVVSQEEHLQAEEEGEFLLSDLIFGYNRIDRDDVRFPFIVKHNHIIPENQNPVIHFEIFGLERDSSGFAHFEVVYQFEPKRGFFSFLRQTSDRLSGTLEFTTADTHFRESLEFDNIPLGKNDYTMIWVVRDIISGHELTRKLEFTVEERDQFTITLN